MSEKSTLKAVGQFVLEFTGCSRPSTSACRESPGEPVQVLNPESAFSSLGRALEMCILKKAAGGSDDIYFA